MTKIQTEVDFCAAHVVQTTESNCSRMHGHNWKAIITINGTTQDDGMVVDFKDIKRLVGELDHKFLVPQHLVEPTEKDGIEYVKFMVDKKRYYIPLDDCEVIPVDVVTAENLAFYLWQVLNGELSATDMIVRVYESEKSWAESEGKM